MMRHAIFLIPSFRSKGNNVPLVSTAESSVKFPDF